jgi:DNA-binding GntR family transcriptional regulator
MHEALEAAIISGELKPGQRLHPDVLAVEYGMSRSPVREALRSLDEAGWVEITPRHGVHVRTRKAEELDELFEFRALVEGRVARWAAERRSDHDVARLGAILEANREALRAPGAAGAPSARSDFFAALRAAASNSVLETTAAALERRAWFYFSMVADQFHEEWLHVHEALLEHVRDQDAAAAESVASNHIRDTAAAVRSLLVSDDR